jgi:hypothetical protein
MARPWRVMTTVSPRSTSSSSCANCALASDAWISRNAMIVPYWLVNLTGQKYANLEKSARGRRAPYRPNFWNLIRFGISESAPSRRFLSSS